MGVNINGDLGNAMAFTHMMMNLEAKFNTNLHVYAASSAAFTILEGAFNEETDLAAEASEDAGTYNHVYEWEQVGRPWGRLFELWLEGSGRNKSITWDWKPSRTVVPINPDDYPADFDTNRLREVHVFIWKAPIMEYGTKVRVKRRTAKALVIPFPNRYQGLGSGSYFTDGNRSVLITQKPYQFSPGANADTVGNFTAWFMRWFSTRAEDVLEQTFERTRDNAFKTAFTKNTSTLRKYQSKDKAFSYSVSSQAAINGARMATNISKDVEDAYNAMARKKASNL